MIQIGQLKLKVGAPDPERLVESSGQSVAAMRRLLDGNLFAGIVAKALHACLKAEHDVHDLAVRIEHAGVAEVRALVRELYGDDEPASEPAADAGSAEGDDSLEDANGEEQA
jgi:hypothetical protein